MSVSDIVGTVIGFPLLGLAQPRHEEFKPRTAWSLFNCFTEVLKDTSFFALPPRTQALHGLLDQFCGVSDLFAH